MSVHAGPEIANDGLVLCLDATNSKSYPGSGTSWYDVSGNNNHFTINATAFNATGPKYMDFNGSYGCAKKIDSDLVVTGDVTAIVWTRVLNNSATWRTLFRGLSSGGDHQVIIQQAGWTLGMYDNVNASGFNGTTFSQQSLPNYGTSNWVMMTWRWNNGVSPYYNFSYNNTPDVIRGSLTTVNARFKCGICSIGAYNNGNQNNPSTAAQYWGDISGVVLYNRYLSDSEVLQYWYATRSRYGL